VADSCRHRGRGSVWKCADPDTICLHDEEAGETSVEPPDLQGSWKARPRRSRRSGWV